MLPDASKFVVNFVEIPSGVRIHGLLSDACTLDTCSVTDDLEKVTCFVMDAGTLTMLCREGDVEANDDDFQRQFSPSCDFSKVV